MCAFEEGDSQGSMLGRRVPSQAENRALGIHTLQRCIGSSREGLHRFDAKVTHSGGLPRETWDGETRSHRAVGSSVVPSLSSPRGKGFPPWSSAQGSLPDRHGLSGLDHTGCGTGTPPTAHKPPGTTKG